ncbi:MAG: RagB/SusD family nutrient uptake outer membrane protein [Cyclobacteriaceae bacterium]
MKTYIINKFKIALCILAIGFSGCDSLVYEEPISEIGPGSFWLNNEDAEAGVIAIYDAMQGTYRLKHFIWGEWRADNFDAAGGSAEADFVELINNNITPGNEVTLRWNVLYVMIYRANLAIDKIPEITAFNPNLLGEAHALRAKAYFDAIRVWGAVPLFTEPTSSPLDASRPATDATTIINEVIIPDMLKAEELINIPSRNSRFSTASVYALQAEVYMWLKDYTNAKIALDNLIALNEHRLVTSVEGWQNLFFNDFLANDKRQVGSELIMSIVYSNDEEGNFGGQFNNRSGIFELFFAGIPKGVFSADIENKWREKFPVDSLNWVTKYPDTDPQLTEIELVTNEEGEVIEVEKPVYGDWRYIWSREDGIRGLTTVQIGDARVAKWTKTNFNRNFDNTDIVIYRFAGMLLLLAEAENKLGNDDRAFEIVNQLRAARLLPPVSEEEFGATMDEREDFILEERRYELFAEGSRWWDLIRTDKVFDVLNPRLESMAGGVPLTQDRLLFPIYFNHLVDNPLLEQNSAY